MCCLNVKILFNLYILNELLPWRAHFIKLNLSNGLHRFTFEPIPKCIVCGPKIVRQINYNLNSCIRGKGELTQSGVFEPGSFKLKENGMTTEPGRVNMLKLVPM